MFVDRPRCVGAMIAAWLLVAGTIVGVESQRATRETQGVREFQAIVGGLGLGSERDLGRCGVAFDPRLGRNCPECTRQSLLGRAVCPAHSLQLLAPK